jgi:hypothetical protein
MPPISRINVEFILSWICRKSSKHQPPASVQHQGQSYEPAINRRSLAITVRKGDGSDSAWRDIDEVPPAINNQLKYYFLRYKRGSG